MTVLHADALDALRSMPDNSVDSIVTDPPYGLAEHKPEVIAKALAAWLSGDREHVPDGRGFMGRRWDAFVPPPAVWDEALRVLKPGGHLLAFAGSRTADLMGISIRLAGFEMRDTITWHYASGFPKSLDVSKAIDKAAGATREITGTRMGDVGIQGGNFANATKRGVIEQREAPATEAAQQWSGWGTALKPASEPIVVARKPLGGTVAACVLEHGTGALNIDGCRVEGGPIASAGGTRRSGGIMGESTPLGGWGATHSGRWPANVVLTHAPDCGPDDTTPCVDGCPVADLDAQSAGTRSDKASASGSAGRAPIDGGVYAGGAGVGGSEVRVSYADGGGASRFFPTFRYQAKAPTRERPSYVTDDGRKIAHPTVKPLALIRWLVRLVTPPGGLVVDPFAGSGTTGEAAMLEGFRAILVELEGEHLPLIAERLARSAPPVVPAQPSAALAAFREMSGSPIG